MKVLLLGSGGREHALAWSLARSRKLEELVCAPGSAALARLGACADADILDPKAVSRLCMERRPDLVIVGPEAPLEAGVADELRADGLAVFGPSRAAARLETSKIFAKDFMVRHGLPTAAWRACRDASQARKAVSELGAPVVVKADGLAGGKGVRVCATKEDALEAVSDFMEAKTLGRAGEGLVVEEFLEGTELSALALTDGKTFRLLPFARDHKRLNDGDKGPNTGGMGVFAPVAVDAEMERKIRTEIFERTLNGLKADGLDYRGVLYAGLILHHSTPKLLEFNCRFGDPETQAILPLIKNDLLAALRAAAEGRLERAKLEIRAGACACVVLASEGYPAKPVTGRSIEGLEALEDQEGLMVFHSGTAGGPGNWTTSGGRVLGVSAWAATPEAARRAAYEAAGRIRFEGMQCRRDIGASVLETVIPAPTSGR